MELVKDIYFNTDKLVENTKVKVSYTGKFYQDNNEKVYIHYGYGENWDNVDEVEMKKTDLGYQTEINLTQSGTLNFCFKNQINEWDNNFGKNYVFNIEKSQAKSTGKHAIDTKNKDIVIPFFGKAFGNNAKNNANNIQNKSKQNQVQQNKMELNIIQPNQKQQNHYKDSNKSKSWNNINPVLDNNSVSLDNKVTNNVAESQISLENKVTNNIINNSITLDNNLSNNITDNSINNINLCGDNILTNNNNQENNITYTNTPNNEYAITVVPTGLKKTFIWTEKIKTTICKFFSYVPKLISGNYKRKVSQDKK